MPTVTIEFTRLGKTYQCAHAVAGDPPSTLTIPFRPCVLRPPFRLELAFLATDDVRGIELYKPVREIYREDRI
ncbi:MAG TPA: hypothetical protein VIX37_11890 [Candidatus Sulfotelmatobacter sp.]